MMMMMNFSGVLPFEEIYLHGLICDSRGMKMSKSVGNVIHPEHVLRGCSLNDLKNDLKNNLDEKLMTSKNYQAAIKKQENNFPNGIPQCGADALRFSLCVNDIQGEFFFNFKKKLVFPSQIF